MIAVTLLSAAVCAVLSAGGLRAGTELLLGVHEDKRGRAQRVTRGRSRAGETLNSATARGTARISYAGIVPYKEERSRSHPRAVACGDASSVGCVLTAAEDGLHNAMAEDRKPGPGKLAIEQAAKGRGFAEWDVSHQSKAARIAARHTVAASSGHGQGPLSPACALECCWWRYRL